MSKESIEELEEKKLETEIDEFVKTTFRITTIHDEVINLPRVGWIVESKVLKSIGNLLKRLPKGMFVSPSSNEDKKKKRSDVDFLNINSDNIVDIISIFCDSAPDEITKIVALITNKDENWVGENLDLEGIIGVLSPFFYGRGLKMRRAISQLKTRVLTET